MPTLNTYSKMDNLSRLQNILMNNFLRILKLKANICLSYIHCLL